VDDFDLLGAVGGRDFLEENYVHEHAVLGAKRNSYCLLRLTDALWHTAFGSLSSTLKCNIG
jgi:hypothetical protein